jgi:hypothetical protein
MAFPYGAKFLLPSGRVVEVTDFTGDKVSCAYVTPVWNGWRRLEGVDFLAAWLWRYGTRV